MRFALRREQIDGVSSRFWAKSESSGLELHRDTLVGGDRRRRKEGGGATVVEEGGSGFKREKGKEK